MRVVALSDTHTRHREIDVPEGDLLIFAGDATGTGTIPELAFFCKWLGDLPHQYKIFIPGNHDFCFENGYRLSSINAIEDVGATYLEDSGVLIEGKTFWGMPYTPIFGDWAFMCGPRRMKEHTDLIPENLDVLITHGPPMGILDEVDGESVGCPVLLQTLRRAWPRHHVFGHIHSGHGTVQLAELLPVHHNVAVLDDSYNVAHRATIFEV